MNITAMLLLAFSTAAPPPHADQPATGKAAPATGQRLLDAGFFDAADTNRDGALSLAEWLAAGRQERGFRLIDADRDGLITRHELIEFLRRVRERRGR